MHTEKAARDETEMGEHLTRTKIFSRASGEEQWREMPRCFDEIENVGRIRRRQSSGEKETEGSVGGR